MGEAFDAAFLERKRASSSHSTGKSRKVDAMTDPLGVHRLVTRVGRSPLFCFVWTD